MAVIPLPAGATLVMSYEVGVDIDIPVLDVETWQEIRRPTAISPKVSEVTVDTATYDDLGAPNVDKISESWSLSFSVQANRLTSGLYTPEVEALKSYTEPDAVGALAVAHVRWYDKPADASTPNANDAYEGEATVSIERGNTGNADAGSWSVTLTGKGRRRQIANPLSA